MDDYEQFRQLHLTQLRRVPEHLWTALHYKLQAEVSQLGHVMLCVSVQRVRVRTVQYSVAWIMECCKTVPHYYIHVQVYDAGDYFMMSPSRGRWRVLVTHRGRLVASDPNRWPGGCGGRTYCIYRDESKGTCVDAQPALY